MRDWSVMTTSRIALEAVKAAALAKGFDWADSQQWYEGHLEAGIIVAPTDQAPGSDPMRTGPARVRRELTVHVDSQEYAVGKDQIFGVLFARVDV